MLSVLWARRRANSFQSQSILLQEHQSVAVLIILTYQDVFSQLPGPSDSKHDYSCKDMQLEEQNINAKGFIFWDRFSRS